MDDNIAADFGTTTPIQDNPFTGAGNYPGAVSYFEQRRAFAGTINKPQNLWMTRSGTESNLSYSLPTRDDDAISRRVAAREANTILHLVPLGDLIMLTGSAEWRVTAVNSDGLTPTTTGVATQSHAGANNAQPVIVNNTFVDNTVAAISADCNSLTSAEVDDWGRSTGKADVFAAYSDNSGPLVRLNTMDNNGINGMVVRGGTLYTASVWDDTDIVHVLRGF